MSSRTRILLATHLVALATAYGVAKSSIPKNSSSESSNAPQRSKSIFRQRQVTGPGDGPLLLAGFLKEIRETRSKYQQLKTTLPVAEDLKSATIAAIAAFEEGNQREDLTEEERASRLAEADVRVLHWMRKDPGDAVDFLAKDPRYENSWLIYSLKKDVFSDVVKENGLMRSLPWLIRNDFTLSFLSEATLDEMKAGGGLALFTKMADALAGTAREAACRHAFLDDPAFISKVGGATPFSDRARLLELARQQPDDECRTALLAGFGRSNEQAAGWLLDLVAKGELTADLADQVKGNLGDAVLSIPSMDLDKRVEARRATKGNETKSRQSIVNELVGGDVTNLLEKGRDWRYEFRHGAASLEDIESAVHAEVNIPAEAEDAVRVTLYRHLSEEDPEKALAVLDGVPEERKRAALFAFTWENQGNVEPDIFLRFLADVPEPVTAQEKDYRTKGWNWKARGFLERYGDDYVDWVKQMPPGIDKDTAMNSLIWATREQNPAKARELNDQLFPKKP